MNWSWKTFDELSPYELYQILALRNEVFVVEQNCVFQDADGKDLDCLHLQGRDREDRLLAYARLVRPGKQFDEPSVGRFVTSPQIRGAGLGREAIRLGIEKCGELYPEQGIRIAAQERLTELYSSFGFKSVGESYLEDGIRHIDMLLTA